MDFQCYQIPVISLRKALERNPDSLKARILLGEELAKSGKIKEAFECFNSAAKVYPEYEIPFLRTGILLENWEKNPRLKWFLIKPQN